MKLASAPAVPISKRQFVFADSAQHSRFVPTPYQDAFDEREDRRYLIHDAASTVNYSGGHSDTLESASNH